MPFKKSRICGYRIRLMQINEARKRLPRLTVKRRFVAEKIKIPAIFLAEKFLEGKRNVYEA